MKQCDKMNILVTGGAGFIGSHIAELWRSEVEMGIGLTTNTAGYGIDRT